MPIERVINAGGIPQNNAVLNQVYANVLNKPVLVPDGVPTSLGSGIFALMATGTFGTIEEAQSAMCLKHRTFLPEAGAAKVYEEVFGLYRKTYFALGTMDAAAVPMGEILPRLKEIAARA